MKIAMLFPGYGSQYIGMGKELYDEYSIIRSYFKQASDLLKIDCEKICFSNPDSVYPFEIIGQMKPNLKINTIDTAYFIIYSLACGIYDLLQKNNIAIDVVAGYDTGQYAAIFAGKGFSFSTGLILLKQYAQLYMKLLDSKYDILKVNGLTSTKLPEYLNNLTTIAAYQSRTQHLVSGTKEGIEQLRLKLKGAAGVTLYDEGVGLGLNSHLMDIVAGQFEQYVQKANIAHLSIPLISSVNGKSITDAQDVKQEIIHVINHPIHWDLVIDQLASVDAVVAIGSQANHLDLIKEKQPDKNVITINTPADIQALAKIA